MDLARRIYEAAHETGAFTLRSGVEANEYFDKYRFESDPSLLSEIAAALRLLVPDDVDLLAGLELGGVPIAVALSSATGLPACFVRSKPKEHGTRRLAEGAPIAGRRLLIVEDVVTSGGQVAKSAKALRHRGAAVENAICVIDRQAGGGENLAAIGVTLRSLYTHHELEQAAR